MIDCGSLIGRIFRLKAARTATHAAGRTSDSGQPLSVVNDRIINRHSIVDEAISKSSIQMPIH
jgi:hypothetical protein